MFLYDLFGAKNIKDPYFGARNRILGSGAEGGGNFGGHFRAHSGPTKSHIPKKKIFLQICFPELFF